MYSFLERAALILFASCCCSYALLACIVYKCIICFLRSMCASRVYLYGGGYLNGDRGYKNLMEGGHNDDKNL